MNLWGHRFFQNPNQKLQRFLPWKFIKGQLISKCLFCVFNFLQKTNKNKSHSSKIEFVHSFFGGYFGLKNHLDFVWPLALSKYHQRRKYGGSSPNSLRPISYFGSIWELYVLDPKTNIFCRKKIQLHFPMNKGLTVPK